MKKYYNILELPDNATQDQIKRQYRRLALRYHPDRNGGDDQRFLEVKEAYEVLTGKINLVQNEVKQESTSRSTSANRQKSTEERIKEAKQRQKDQAYKEHIENEKYFQKITSGWKWKLIKSAAFLSIFLCTMLTVDLFLPSRMETVRIIGYNDQSIGGIDATDKLKKYFLENGDAYYAEQMLMLQMYDADIALAKSRIFRNEQYFTYLNLNFRPEEIHSEEDLLILVTRIPKDNEFKIQFTLGSHVYLLIPIFLIPIVIMLFKRRTYFFTLGYYLSLYLSIPLILLYLIVENRWIYLITFGLD